MIFETVQTQISNLKHRDHEIYGLEEDVDWTSGHRRNKKRCLLMDPCRFGTMCWRPLCLYGHACSGKRAFKWAETWASLATQEEADKEDEEQIVDLEEEILKVVKDILGECVLGAHHGIDRRVFWAWSG